MQFSPIIPPTRKIAREDAENSEMLHKWIGTNAIGANVGDGVLDVPPAPAGRVSENRRFSVGRPGGRPLRVRIRRSAAVIVGVYRGTVDARSLHWDVKNPSIHRTCFEVAFVGASIARPPKNTVFRILQPQFRLTAMDFALQNPRTTDGRPYIPLENTQKRPRFKEPGSSHTKCSFQYAERKLATSRAILLDCRQVKCIRHEFVNGHWPQKIPRFRRNGGFPIQIVLSNTPSGN